MLRHDKLKEHPKRTSKKNIQKEYPKRTSKKKFFFCSKIEI
jgi:hypothetical protein